jgi:hypothetical protein
MSHLTVPHPKNLKAVMHRQRSGASANAESGPEIFSRKPSTRYAQAFHGMKRKS